MTAREVIAYAITHAPPGVKGGPYQGQTGHATTLGMAVRLGRVGARAVAERARALNDGPARVIRIVRARPSEAEPTQQPHEASAVEVLRELVAWSDNEDADTDDVIRIATKARRVLAASGPNPMPVVRAAMAEERARVRMARAQSGADLVALESEWLRRVEETRVAVKKYRKAGGK